MIAKLPPVPKSHSRWPMIVVGLLVCQAVGVGALIRFATSDPSFAIEPAYYDRALRWDEEQAARSRAEMSGWKFVVTAASFQAVPGSTFTLDLNDKAGNPVTDAVVTLDLFPITRPRERLTLRAIEKEPGRYAAAAPSSTPGTWEARVICRARNLQYLHHATVNLSEKSDQ